MKKVITFLITPRLSYLDFAIVLFIVDVIIPIVLEIIKGL